MADKDTNGLLNLGYDDTAEAHKVLMVNSSGQVIKSTEQEENRLGSDCSGSDGQTGRILTLQNTSESGAPNAVWAEDQLVASSDVTFTHLESSSTLTFNIGIFDLDSLRVKYYV